MLINEACKRSGLTKKALEYYEAKGLVAPDILENGYRDYSDADIAVLKEVSVLRRCGVAVADVKRVLDSANKPAALAKCGYIADLRLQRQQAVHKCLHDLVGDYDIEKQFRYLQSRDAELFTIKERLVLAFPGDYGLFLSLHFGRFLNDERVDTDEKRRAYAGIIRYLDSVELHIPPELSEFLESFINNAAQLAAAVGEATADMIADTETYWEQRREEIEEYLAYKNSDEYRQSPAAGIEAMLREFQRQSGYRERLVGNMRILSASYATYLAELETANEKFIHAFPQAKDIDSASLSEL